ncbi:hypothetical protein [Actinomadura sp. SCN-SB]|uniref:hypothetical protein n=1 Tax=Actinomadura sp. SCN-SB TaxID=3373092 RepID=UPI0037539457
MVRGGLVFGAVLLGLAVSSAAYLLWGMAGAVLIALAGITGEIVALAWLCNGLLNRLKIPLVFTGILALTALHIAGVLITQDLAMKLVGVDAEAVVERTWTTKTRGSVNDHCTLRHVDGRSIRGELESGCRGHRVGDTIPVVLDPEERLAPVGGPKSDLSIAPEAVVMTVAGLVLTTTIVIGSLPVRPGQRSRTITPGW